MKKYIFLPLFLLIVGFFSFQTTFNGFLRLETLFVEAGVCDQCDPCQECEYNPSTGDAMCVGEPCEEDNGNGEEEEEPEEEEEEPEVNCSSYTETDCDYSCPNEECGTKSVSGDEVELTYWECDDGSSGSSSTKTGSSCTGTCHYDDCPDNEIYCNGDSIMERSWSCSNNQCVDSSEEIEDCSDRDGLYCSSDEEAKENRDYTCSGGSCDYDVVDTESCYDLYDINEDPFYDEYGDRTFCRPAGSGPDVECESIPIVHNLSWNEIDHNYDYYYHGDDGYQYCNSQNPDEVRLSWDYHSQTEDAASHYILSIFWTEYTYSGGGVYNGLLDPGYTLERHYLIEDYIVNDDHFVISGRDLDFDTEYGWEVKAVDENGYESEWFESSFETDKRRADVDFSWEPEDPFVEEATHFEDDSRLWNGSIVSREWEFEGANPQTGSGSEVTVEFDGQTGSRSVNLLTIDSDRVRCSKEKAVRVRSELPDWREADPFSFLKNLFGSLNL